jgi:hypothetical protein
MGTVIIEGNTVFNIRPQKCPKLHDENGSLTKFSWNTNTV